MYNIYMDKESLISQLYAENKKISEIAQAVNLTNVRVIQILKKLKLRDTSSKYSKKVSSEEKLRILELNNSGKTLVEIFKSLDESISKPTIKKIILSSGNSLNIVRVDKSRPCVICGTVFVPKYGSSKNLDRDKTCSSKCRNKLVSLSKSKYTKDEIESVISLKKKNIPNNKIVKITGVNLNKIKEIVKKESLFVPKHIAQQNAYKAKLEKNPDSMLKMREKHMKFSQEEYEKRIRELIEDVKKGNGTITGLAPKYGLNGNSVIVTLKTWGGYEGLISLSVSTGQKEISKFVKSLGLSCIYDSRKVIPPKEIDIFIPKLSLGIEYCGIYWHTEDSGKDRNYHVGKFKECNNRGIRLITIFEDEWLERKKQVISFLKSALGKNKTRINGRDCIIKTVSRAVANNFYDENHIQGAPLRSILDIGIFSKIDNELLGCMSFGSHHRNGHLNIAILTRLAFTEDVTVIGGASKMFKFSIDLLRQQKYIKVVSWSDNRWSEGNVYRKLGFLLDESLPPDYSYVFRNKRLSKQSNQKKHLLSKGAVGDTEYEMAKSLGYSRIYDCGKKRWIYSLT